MTTLLVTGGSGSLGLAIVQKALSRFESVIGLSNDEHQIVEAGRLIPDAQWVLCDIRGSWELRALFHDYAPTHVIHAAAVKHVSICEQFPTEAWATNVEGSRNVIFACNHDHWGASVEKVLAVSSDKAVNPISVYGRSKREMELSFLHAGFNVIRSGNFMGSRGSVVPLWAEQTKTGTITLTDPEAVRYFIELDDMADECLKHLERDFTGEAYVPPLVEWTMGALATKLHPDANWHITGLRPGEKLREELG